MIKHDIQVPAGGMTAHSPDPAGTRFLGGPAQLSVNWIWEGGHAVVVQLLSQTTLPACLIHTCKLSMKTAPACRFRMPTQFVGPQERNAEILLEYAANDCVQLRADIPIDTRQWFREVLSTWTDPLDPDWRLNPDDPDWRDSPSWNPPDDPNQAHGPDTAKLRGHHPIFNFHWLRDISPIGSWLR